MWEVVLAKAKVYLPEAADKVLHAVGLKLLGKLLEIPEAWADQRLQALRDATEAKSLFSKALAQAAAEKAITNPEIVDAVAEALVQDYSKRLFNKAKVFRLAVTEIASDSGASNVKEEPDEDWLNSFARLAEDASSERLQATFSKILAGELKLKGTYSISTLRIVSELNQFTADAFAQVYSEQFGGTVFRDQKYSRSPDWDRINLLRDAGFVSAADSSVHMPPGPLGDLPNGRRLWRVGEEATYVIIEFDPKAYSEIPIYNLTRMGIEIGTLLPPPDVALNLRTMTERNTKRSGWHRITLVRPGGAETIFDTGQDTVPISSVA